MQNSTYIPPYSCGPSLDVALYLKVIQDRFVSTDFKIAFETDHHGHVYNLCTFDNYCDALSHVVNTYGPRCCFNKNAGEYRFDFGFRTVVLTNESRIKTHYDLFPDIHFKRNGAISFNQIEWPL